MLARYQDFLIFSTQKVVLVVRVGGRDGFMCFYSIAESVSRLWWLILDLTIKRLRPSVSLPQRKHTTGPVTGPGTGILSMRLVGMAERRMTGAVA